MWTSKSGSCSSIALIKPGKLAMSRSWKSFIVPWALMTNRKSIFPSHPSGFGGPKSGKPVLEVPSVSVPLLLLLVEFVDVDDELSAGISLDELLVDDSDSAAAAVALVGMPAENPVSERGPPQATRAPVRVRH